METSHRQAVASMWALGDYARLAERLEPAAKTIADIAGAGQERRAIDVAAGTGSVAIHLAQRGWRVDACDISPALIERGTQACTEAGVDVQWHECSLDELPFEDSSCDLIASSFGLIFAPDTTAAVNELHRCLRPGGQLIFSAWTPAGYMGQMTAVMAEFMPQAPTGPTPMDWGIADNIPGKLGDAFAELSIRTENLPWHFDSAEAATEFCFEHSPAHLATLAMAGERADDLRAAFRAHLVAKSDNEQSIRIDAEYIVATASTH